MRIRKPRYVTPRGHARIGVLAACVVVAGCSSIGPGTVVRDRFDYSRTIAESWKLQALLNIVKLRYVDPPVYIDVGQVVSGYSLETGVNLGGTVGGDDEGFTLGTAGRYTDRPTVTYTPLTGNRFMRAAMMPLPPQSVFFVIQAGWPADGVLFSAVASLNGLKNQEATLTGVTPPDPDFLRVLELLRRIQHSGAVGIRIHQDVQKHQTTILAFHTRGITEETLADIAEVRRLLRLDPEAHEFRLVYGATPADDRELAVVTRSLVHIMATMAAYVDVPPGDVTEGRATPGLAPPAPLHIRCSRDRPADAFAAVSYRDHWFWIDDRDLRTKRAFGLLMMMFTLADTGPGEPLPLITIPCPVRDARRSPGTLDQAPARIARARKPSQPREGARAARRVAPIASGSAPTLHDAGRT
jgi:hypothetical protein